MELTPEIIAEAKQIAASHKLKEVFVTEKGEFFSSAREARNSKAKEVTKAFTLAEEVPETDASEEETAQKTESSTADLHTDSTETEGANESEKEPVTTTITDPEEETEPVNSEQLTVNSEDPKTEPAAQEPKAKPAKPEPKATSKKK